METKSLFFVFNAGGLDRWMIEAVMAGLKSNGQIPEEVSDIVTASKIESENEIRFIINWA